MPMHRTQSYADLLGGFQLVIDGRQITAWRAGRSRSLVQYLLVHRNRPVRTERLREVIWPHLPPTAGTTSVKSAIYGARQALGAAASASGGSVTIDFTGDGYVLRTDGFSTDVDTLRAAVAAGAASERSGDLGAAAAHYRNAVAVYGGAFLPGEDTLWALEQREQLRTLALRATGFLIDRARRRRDDWELIEWCQRVLSVDPCDPVAFESIIETHERLGLRRQAQRWHRVRQSRTADI